MAPGAVRETASDIDRRRARQLLERAFILHEQGALNDAILACRQAINLAPQLPQGYSLLGLLLERRNDIPHAIEAYERVLALAPDSALEQDSLQRLRAKLARTRKVTGKAAGFDFNEADLYENLTPPPASQTTPPPRTPNTASGAVIPAAVVSATAAAEAAGATAASTSAASPTIANAPVASTPAPALPRRAPRSTPRLGTVPAAGTPTASAPGAGLNSAAPNSAAPAVTPFDPVLDLSLTPESSGVWTRLLSHPSYFYRGIPLLLAAVFSLLFLSWAQHRASVRYQTNPSAATRVSALPSGEQPETAPETAAPDAARPNAARPNGAAGVAPNAPASPAPTAAAHAAAAAGTAQNNNPGSPFQIGNAPPQPAANDRAAPRDSNANSNAPRAANNLPRRAPASSGASPRPRPENSVPPFPVLPPVAPSLPTPLRPSAEARAPEDRSTLEIPSFPAVPPTRLPSFQRPRSSGPVATLPLGNPNPGQGADNSGNATSGIIRITPHNPSPATAPARPQFRAREAERNASRAANSGNASGALNQLNEALRSGGGTGWNYQQRGLIQLQNGEYDRAIDSFRTAIGAYEEQIARGENVGEARAGIQACRSGIRTAQAQKQ